MNVLGLDPGISGAYATWDGENLICLSVPSVKSSGRGREVDWIELRDSFNVMFSKIDHAFIEKVNARPQDGGSSAFKFGYTAGAQRMIVTMADVPITEVSPTEWKTRMGLNNDKNKSLALAKQMFPTFTSYFSRKSDDGVAEAALLAYFGRQRLLGEKPR